MHADEVRAGDTLEVFDPSTGGYYSVLVTEARRSRTNLDDGYFVVSHSDDSVHYVRGTSENTPEGKPSFLEVVYPSAKRVIVIASIHGPGPR